MPIHASLTLGKELELAFIRNRLLFHIGRRLLQGMLFSAGILAGACLLLVGTSLSEEWLGSAIPAAVAYLIMLLGVGAWILAKDDVERERRDRDRVLDRLTRDQ